MEVENDDPIGDTPIFDFHDYGRKCIEKLVPWSTYPPGN